MSARFGPNREAAVVERKSTAHCVICDAKIGNGLGKRSSDWTCRSPSCQARWSYLGRLDAKARA